MPPISEKILIREEERYRIREIDGSDESSIIGGPTKRSIVFSRDRTIIGIIENFTIHLYRLDTFEKIYSIKMVSDTKAEEIEKENRELEEMIDGIKAHESSKFEEMMLKKRIENDFIQAIDISPDNRFLVAANKFVSEAEPNLTLREIATNSTIFAMSQRNFNSEAWPVFKWFGTSSAAIFAYKDLNKLAFFDSHVLAARATSAERANLAEPVAELSFGSAESDAAGYGVINDFSLSPHSSHVALFLKSRAKDRPSKIQIYLYPDLETPVARVFAPADSVQFHWAAGGGHLMARTFSNSLKSYYSTSRLFLFSLAEKDAGGEKPRDGPQSPGAAKGGEKEAETKESGKEPKAAEKIGRCREVFVGKATLHDFEFSNKGDQFAVIAFDPIRPKIYRTEDGKVLRSFEPMKCNRVVWSPDDRLAWIAGVQNMSGNMTFWDMRSFRRLGEGRHQGARAHHWSSDGKFFVTASLAPWRQVDNCFKIWSFCGKLIKTVHLPRLYQCGLIPRAGAKPFAPEDLESLPAEIELLAGPSPDEAAPKPKLLFSLPKRASLPPPAARGAFAARRGRGRGSAKKEAAAPDSVKSPVRSNEKGLAPCGEPSPAAAEVKSAAGEKIFGLPKQKAAAKGGNK